MSLNFLNSQVKCQKPNSHLAFKMIFDNLSADISIRHSFHFMKGKKKKILLELQKDLYPFLPIWVSHFLHINAIAFMWGSERHQEVWGWRVNCRSALLLSTGEPHERRWIYLTTEGFSGTLILGRHKGRHRKTTYGTWGPNSWIPLKLHYLCAHRNLGVFM